MFEYIWSQKYRPQTLIDLVLTEKDRKYFEGMVKSKQIPNLLFSGNPGVGKTSTAKVLINELGCDHLYINASDETGIDTIRHKVISFSETRSFNGGIKVVILDEADGLSASTSGGRSSAQQALRNVMEEYSETTRFILTANYPSKIIPALHSRCQHVEIIPPFKECTRHCIGILKKENISVDKDQHAGLVSLIKTKYPDMRKIINSLQHYSSEGVLDISDESEEKGLCSKIFKMIRKKEDLQTIRKYIIDNEQDFANYHDLLKGLFEIVFESDLEQTKKASMMLIITEAMYRHSIVLDQEINSFSAIIQLSQI